MSQYKKITKEDVVNLSKKVAPHTLYLLEGNCKEEQL